MENKIILPGIALILKPISDPNIKFCEHLVEVLEEIVTKEIANCRVSYPKFPNNTSSKPLNMQIYWKEKEPSIVFFMEWKDDKSSMPPYVKKFGKELQEAVSDRINLAYNTDPCFYVAIATTWKTEGVFRFRVAMDEPEKPKDFQFEHIRFYK